MRKKSDTLQENETFVKTYNDSKYPKPSVTTDIVIFGKFQDEEHPLKILLIKRKAEPFKDCYALPGGFANPDEDLRQAAARELEEETHIPCDFLEQFGTYSTPGRDPRRWVISNGFQSVVDGQKCQVQADDDAKEAAWFDFSFVQENGLWKLLMTNGEECLRATIRDISREKDIKQRFISVESEELAFDHELIIADAIMQLRRWKPELCK